MKGLKFLALGLICLLLSSVLVAQNVKLNYKGRAVVTYQQIITAIKKSVTRDLEQERSEYKLKKIVIEDKTIRVYFNLQFRPSSKSWVKKEGWMWLGGVIATGLYDADYNFIGNVYSTGYNISVYMWTWFSENELVSWGHITLFNSGKPFTMSSVRREAGWMDGPGMKMLK